MLRCAAHKKREVAQLPVFLATLVYVLTQLCLAVGGGGGIYIRYIRGLMVVDLTGLSWSTITNITVRLLSPLVYRRHLLLLSKQQLAVLLSGSFTAAHLRLTKTRSCCETNTIQVVKNIATTATANFAELCDKVFVVNAP